MKASRRCNHRCKLHLQELVSLCCWRREEGKKSPHLSDERAGNRIWRVSQLRKRRRGELMKNRDRKIQSNEEIHVTRLVFGEWKRHRSGGVCQACESFSRLHELRRKLFSSQSICNSSVWKVFFRNSNTLLRLFSLFPYPLRGNASGLSVLMEWKILQSNKFSNGKTLELKISRKHYLFNVSKRSGEERSLLLCFRLGFVCLSVFFKSKGNIRTSLVHSFTVGLSFSSLCYLRSKLSIRKEDFATQKREMGNNLRKLSFKHRSLW